MSDILSEKIIFQDLTHEEMIFKEFYSNFCKDIDYANFHADQYVMYYNLDEEYVMQKESNNYIVLTKYELIEDKIVIKYTKCNYIIDSFDESNPPFGYFKFTLHDVGFSNLFCVVQDNLVHRIWKNRCDLINQQENIVNILNDDLEAANNEILHLENAYEILIEEKQFIDYLFELCIKNYTILMIKNTLRERAFKRREHLIGLCAERFV